MDERLRKTIATSANRHTERLLGEPVPHIANQHQAAESKNHHGQTTTLSNNREGISLAGRGTPHCAVSARQVHAGHSPWDETWRCDDVPYSFGITILVLIVLRLLWRITHPVAPASSLPAWQRLMSEAVHWLLYALVLATRMTGWIFASERGWSIRLFFAIPLPTLPTEGSLLANSIGKWHGTMEWALLLVIGAHVARTSAMTYKNAHKPLAEIARELNVDAVVEGSVLHSGERVRIVAQLIQVPADKQIWAESYEGDFRDTWRSRAEWLAPSPSKSGPP